MNIPAAKSKITSLNSELQILSTEDGEILSRVFDFLIEKKTVDLDGEGGEKGEGLMRIVQSWPEAQRFPCKPILLSQSSIIS